MIRRLWLLTILVSGFCAGFAQVGGSLPFLKPAEQRQYLSQPKFKDRMKLYRKVLIRYQKELPVLSRDGQTDRVRRALAELRTLVAVASEETPIEEKEFRSKPVKKLEIELRRILEDWQDWKLTSGFDAHDDFDRTAQELEAFRQQLLGHLLGSNSAWVQVPIALRPTPLNAFAPSSPSRSQRRAATTVTGDQFTEEEVEEIRDAQELKKRVKVLLEIAEKRLVEIERRMAGQEWEDEDNENPLEFYTNAMMMRAYQRSVETLMINVDEKARHKMVKEKELKQSLEMINDKMQSFLPRLRPIRELSEKELDEELYLELRKAAKHTETALKGSQMALGAPVKP